MTLESGILWEICLSLLFRRFSWYAANELGRASLLVFRALKKSFRWRRGLLTPLFLLKTVVLVGWLCWLRDDLQTDLLDLRVGIMFKS